MTMKEELIEKIKNRTLTMGVCGLGYVGLPLAVDKAKHGFHTIGFDVQQEKVDMVNAGKNYIGDVVNSDLEELVSSGMLSATTDRLRKELQSMFLFRSRLLGPTDISGGGGRQSPGISPLSGRPP